MQTNTMTFHRSIAKIKIATCKPGKWTMRQEYLYRKMSMINCRIQHFTLVMMPNSMSLCVCVCLNLCPFPHIHIENYMMRKLTLKDTLFFKEKNIINGIKFSLFSNNAVHQHLNIFFFLMRSNWFLLKCLGHAGDIKNKMISFMGSCFNF